MISPRPVPERSGYLAGRHCHLRRQVARSGVCRHQALGQAFGAEVVRARAVMHGKTSAIRHPGVGVFHGLSDPPTVTRYHCWC